jgi:transposase
MRVVGKIFNVGKSSISRWLLDSKNYSIQSRIKNRKEHHKNRNIILIIKEILGDNWIGRAKDVQNILEKEHKIIKSISTIWRIIRNLGLSYKQVRKKVEMNKNTEEIKNNYKRDIRELGYNKVLCFDEVGFQLEMDPKKGWSRKGTRCVIKKSKGGRTNYSGCFLISSEGVEHWEIKKGSVKSDDLLKFFGNSNEDILKGKTLVLDNARTHHKKEVKDKLTNLEIIGKYLPPYSPELNPIEEVFGWLKTELRRMKIRKEDELKNGIELLVKKIREKGILERFKHSYD